MKRFLLSFITVLFFGCFNFAKAQYVTIPDATFVSWLNTNGYAACISGNQLDTTCSTVINAVSMHCNAVSIRDLTGVQYFKNLDTLDCSNDSLYVIPALPPLLVYFSCASNNLDSLPALPTGLQEMLCEFNNLGALPLLPSPIVILGCNDNQLTALPVLPASLEAFTCNDNLLTALPALPTALQDMDCSDNNITALPALPASMTTLDCEFNQLTSVPALPPNLSNFWCYKNQITSLPALPSLLNNVNCSYNQLTTLPSLPASLQQLDCSYNHITALPTLPNSLWLLSCEYNQLSALPALSASLLNLDCSNNLVTSLPAMPAYLVNMSCSHNQLTVLPVLPASMGELICSHNPLTTLPALPAGITSLWCQADSPLTTMPALPDSLYYFYCDSNPQLTCLPELKRIVNFSWHATGLTCLPDYGEITYSSPALSSLPLCGIYNGSGCEPFWNISGQCFYSPDSSCVFDNASVSTGYVKTQLYSGGNLVQQVYSGGEGFYSFDTVPYGHYTVLPDTGNLPFIVGCPNSGNYPVILSAADSLSYGNNFAFRCRTQGFDVGVQSVLNGYTTPRPATVFTLSTIAGDMSELYGAHCATGISGTVQMVFSGPITYTGPAAGALVPTSVNGSTITWNIADYGAVNDLTAFNLLFKIDSLAVPGTSVCFTVNVTPTTGDYNPSNNTLTYCFPVVASLDPNEKEVYPTQIDSANQWLTYTIRFQNTGTASALNIRVVDTLSQNLDASTFQLLAYSARNVTQIFGDVVVFNFPNINLADSLTSDSASRGFVQYKIKAKGNAAQGTVISNRASIYFDSNPPVVTNTVTDSVLSCVTTYATLNDSICSGDTVYVGTHAYYSVGTYVDTLTNGNGCDSVVTLMLAVKPSPVVTFSWDSLLMANDIELNYSGGWDTLWCPFDDFPETFPMSGGSPVGGIYSGHGISNNIFYYDSLYGLYMNQHDTITYTYTDSNLCSASAYGSFLISMCTSISDISGNSAIALYPNPTTGLIYIKTEGIQPNTTSIYDVNGQLVYTSRFMPQLDVSKLTAGAYLIEVTAPEGEARRVFVKM